MNRPKWWLAYAPLIPMAWYIGTSLIGISNLARYTGISTLIWKHSVFAIWALLLLASTGVLIFFNWHITRPQKWSAAAPHGPRPLVRKASYKARGHFLLTTAFLVPISLAFLYIFSFPTIRSKPDFESSFATSIAEPVSEPLLTLINTEHHQALDEIKLRIEHDDEWFHIKFLLIGGLFTLFGTLLVLERIEIGREKSEHRKGVRVALFSWLGRARSSIRQHVFGFEEMLSNPITASIFGIVVVIAVNIDLHVRTSYMVVHQLANWILTRVDPVLNCNKSVYSSLCEKSTYMPWENFLRISTPGSKGMHEDFLWNLFYTPHIHYSTWMIYMIYLLLLFWLCRCGTLGQRKGPVMTTIVLFVFVHLALGVFAFVGHAAPASFHEKLLVPYLDVWISGEKAGYVFLIVWVIMCVLVTSRLYAVVPANRLRRLYGMKREEYKRKISRVHIWSWVMCLAGIFSLTLEVLSNIYTLEERELGYIVVNRMRMVDEEDGQAIAVPDRAEANVRRNPIEYDTQVDLFVEAPNECLSRLKAHEALDAIQASLGAQEEITYKYTKAVPTNRFDEFRLMQNMWYSKKLEEQILNVICNETGCCQGDIGTPMERTQEVRYDSAQEPVVLAPERSGSKPAGVKVFFQKAGNDKEDEIELPEFVANLKQNEKQKQDLGLDHAGSGMILRAKVVVKASTLNVWRIKKKEAQIIDMVYRCLQDFDADNPLNRQEQMRRVVSQKIGEAIGGNIKENECRDTNQTSIDTDSLHATRRQEPRRKRTLVQVFIKEFLIYDPRHLIQLGDLSGLNVQ